MYVTYYDINCHTLHLIGIRHIISIFIHICHFCIIQNILRKEEISSLTHFCMAVMIFIFSRNNSRSTFQCKGCGDIMAYIITPFLWVERSFRVDLR